MKRSCCVLLFVIAMASAGTLAAQSPPNFSGAGGTTLTVLHAFGAFPGGGDGASPDTDLIQGNDGNFYGTTSGGAYNNGSSVFEVTPAGAFSVPYVFGANGTTGGLIEGSDGNFYGTTRYRGFGDGTVFQLTPDGFLYYPHSFSGADGADPEAGLTLGTDGSFYGTTYSGGDSNGDGVIFKITLAGDFTVLYTFTGGAGGSGPYAGLTLGSDGNFYGTTLHGGDTNGDGTIFKITPAGVFTTLHIFLGGSDGRLPYGGLIQASDGNFYGTTDNGGGGYGTVFKITPDGVLTTLYAFKGGADGAYPFYALTQGADGNLYGATSMGGDSNGDGTIFKITPAGILTTLYTFTGGADGANPIAGLTQIGDGAFYGTASNGGQNGLGVVFQLTLPPAPAVTGGTASGQVGSAFSFQIVATNSPTNFAASNLPPGLSVDAATGLISGIPTQSGAFTVGLSATNSGATGAAVLNINLAPALPVVTLAATVPQAVIGSGNAGEFTVSLPAPQTADVVIAFAIKGTAINGVDYQLIKASKKIKAGKTSKVIKIVPQGDLEGASKKVVALALDPGTGYTIGTTGKVKVKILFAP